MVQEATLRSPGRRLTRQRRLILQILESRRDHPGAQEILEEAKKVQPSISLGTVYRNLKVLAEQGVIKEISTLGEGSRFDAQPVPHSHLVCRRCGKVVDVHFDLSETLDAEVSKQTGFLSVSHALTFYGVCPDCATEAELKQGWATERQAKSEEG